MTTQELENACNISSKHWNKFSKKEKEKWYKKKREFENEWMKWLFNEYGVEKNVKREKCIEIAWEMGHSCGYREVEYIFGTLVDLIN